MIRKKQLYKRILSLLLAANLTVISVSLDEIIPDSWVLPTIIKATAEHSPTIKNENSTVFNENENGEVSITSLSVLKDYAYYYSTSETFADAHEDDKLRLTLGATEYTIDANYIPIGTFKHPFNGSLLFTTTMSVYTLETNTPLFDYITDDAIIGGNVILNLYNRAEDHVLLANHVTDGDENENANGTAMWNLYLDDISNKELNTSAAYSGVIGEMAQNTSITLNFTNYSSAAVSGANDTGMICGTMRDNSHISLSLTKTNHTYNVASATGNAGILVGSMNPRSSVELVKISEPSASSSVTASASESECYAGGLVGWANDASINVASGGMTVDETVGVNNIPVQGSVTAMNGGAGGVFGYYQNTQGTNTAPYEFDLVNYNNTATVDGKYCGGVFGVLENSDSSLTIKNTGSGTLAVSSGSTGNASGYFGGIAGKYTASTLSDSLVLNELTLTANANAAYSAFGGAIGIVDPAAYVQTTGTMSVTASGTTSSGYFGGLVGATSADHGVFVDLGSFKLNAGTTENDTFTAEEFKGGGIVGNFHNGVLRLSGTTDMTNGKPASAVNCGQLVGKNDNVLTYAASGWTFSRSSGALTDDLGTWGEVVRIADIEDTSASPSANAILTLDPTAHTIIVKDAAPSMGTPVDFAKTALNIQLNQGSDYDCLKFTSGNNTRSYLLGTGLSLSADISLSNTGITGFMRDGGDVSTIGSFTGTFDGNNHTLTLAIGEKYGNGVTASTNSEGVGQIYRHQHNGLFSVLAGTVQNLTVAGTINTHSSIDGFNIGGVAAQNGGAVTLTKVTSDVTVNDYGDIAGTEAAGKNIGGYIGFVGTNGNGTITINGVSSIGATFNLSGKHQGWNTYGGIIGKITAGNFIVNVGTASDKLTNKLNVTMTDLTNTSDNSDSGGLIGYITNNKTQDNKDANNYNDRIVNLNNVEFDGCIVGNAANTNGGGFLGYAWLNTSTNVDGVTVTNGTINNSTAPNVGVMLYSSTGKMKVDSLEINGLTMSAGGGTSLGMIVNKAFDGNSGLYLDVLNSGYTLTGSGISLPSSLGVFDELAAYSASNVLNGGNGAGVISVNMNSARTGTEPKITVTGTYQNQLTNTSSNALVAAKYANDKSRYYYNLDVLNNSDSGQNLLLWSVNKYAASNIANEFKSTTEHPFGTTFTNTLSGNANMTGLSFYPLVNAGGYTLNALNLTFDYSGIYATAENVFRKVENADQTDGYIRDPASGNQHFLMHSGLFINNPAGNTITVAGTSSIGGTFLEVGNYKAALISGTMNGNLKITGSLELKGLTPMTSGNAAYADGYLLVNSISRPDTQTQTITMELKDISTSGYSSTAQTAVAKSLIGPADGRSLTFKFSGIKLDARKAVVPDTTVSGVNAALTDAYGTSRSIFSDATLVYSINTDQYGNLIYNYTRDEDWGSSGNRNVTYGSEISNSKEYAGQENKYYGDPRNYTRPDADSNEVYSFLDTIFLPYVCEPHDLDADHTDKYYREIKVNVLSTVEWKGCGTYNDPYIITDGEQLEKISIFLQTGNTDDLGSIILPIYDSSKHNGITNNTTGSRWCTDKVGNSYHVLYQNNGTAGFTASGKNSWPAADAQYYLAGAYYKIGKSFELSTKFRGLGGTTANTAFRGVIVGEKDQSGSPGYTIINKSDKPFITVTNGCVIKDVNINIDNNIVLTQANNGYNNAYFGYDHTTVASVCRFYGGVIGEIMGGDNIIDNSYVKFEDGRTVTLSGSNGTIVPVGGYVGVVVFGGLIFKNMDARKTAVSSTGLNVVYSNGNTHTTNGINLADSTDSTNQESWAAIYVNPIVGRVINGYAVNETGGNALDADGEPVQQFSVTEDGKYHDEGRTARSAATVQHTLKNGTKHYSIADIDPYYGKTAEQWNALTDAGKNALVLDVTPPVNTTTDGTINVPNAQAMFILSLITQSTSGTAQTADGDYQNSLSYGINSSNVYGMSHNADYSAVGTNAALVADDPETVEVDETTVSDYQKFASEDTAANTAVPYIIRKYTKYVDDTVTNTTTIANAGDTLSCDVKYLDGHQIYIKQGTDYLNNIDQGRNSPYGLKATTVQSDAAKWTVELVPGTDNKYYIYTTTNDGIRYLRIWQYRGGNYHLALAEKAQASQLTIQKNNSSYGIGDKAFIDNWGGSTAQGFSAYDGGVSGNRILTLIAAEDITDSVTTGIKGYPARCVTSTLGYYDINLTGSDYVLPDSFRGLGSVGLYDSQSPGNNNQVEPAEAEGGRKNNGTTDGWQNRANNKFSIKLDQFDGNSQNIDVDIYLNKFLIDNYFNKMHDGASQTLSSDNVDYEYSNNKQMHGIGLFDSVITKNAESAIKHFTLKGSVNTEVYGYRSSDSKTWNNSYTVSNQELTGALSNKGYLCWLSSGGIVGWTIDGEWMTFENIELYNMSVRGSMAVGGLLGYSGNKSKTYYIVAERCRGTNLKLELSAINTEANRCAVGGFVGKVKEGGVRIYGTDQGKNNNNLSNYSSVEIGAFNCVDNNASIAGGLVGYAGNGCQAYDMRIKAKNDSTVIIGTNNTNMAGGIVGLMQPVEQFLPDCIAEFVNCEVREIDISANKYAGGFYGGTWNTGNIGWVANKIVIDNCKMIGNSSERNTISAQMCAGGFVADGLVWANAVPNIEIKDSLVSNYNISNNVADTIIDPVTEYKSDAKGKGEAVGVGGFIGYADSQYNIAHITCYIHDSAIENCNITAKNSGGHSGGVVGQVVDNTANTTSNNATGNRILGYNIKLKNVTSDYPERMGAWIGILNSTDTTTSIQFAGLAIYGNGFTGNVGNAVSLSDASFVFAAYDEAMLEEGDENNEPDVSAFNATKIVNNEAVSANVDMPKYPYVNINPQSSMGNGEIISGDGAVLLDDAVDGYGNYTSAKTMAARLYADSKLTDSNATNYSRRYTTFSDGAINGTNTIEHYLKQTKNAAGDRISTWETEKGSKPAGVKNFAMIIIANESAEETTNLINRYIQLVTNTATNYSTSSPYYNIVPKACVYNTGSHKFEVTDGVASISYTAGNTNAFSVVRDGADSLATDKFTLLDVQFKDPLNTDNIAYHLYVPVYVKRAISASFASTAHSGTKLLAPEYRVDLRTYDEDAATNHRLIENLDNWITAYINYQYSVEEINAILNSGMLDWNAAKQLKLGFSTTADGRSLPDDAKLVLIDPNGDIDKAYYANGSELGGNTFALSAFYAKNAEERKIPFTEQHFGDILGDSVEATLVAGTGYYDPGSPENYDIRIGDSYYSYVAEKTGQYNLTASKVFNEDYYISMLVPSDINETVYLFDIQSSESLSGKMVTYVTNLNHADILLGDLFEQNYLTHTVNSETGAEIINESNKKITVEVVSTVKIKGDDSTLRKYYADYLVNTPLYHANMVTFTRHDISGSDNTIYGTDSSKVLHSGTVDGSAISTELSFSSSYVMVKTGNIRSQVVAGAENENYDGATISQTIAVVFPNFEEEFPSRPADQETTYGVNAFISSNISYDLEEIAYSGKKIPYTDTKRYYVEKSNSATLKYKADDELDLYDSVGSASHNHSHLGNNGLDRFLTCMWPDYNVGMPIKGTAKYNAASVTNYDKADTIVYTLTMYRKTDSIDEETGVVTGVEYQQVNIDNYLKNVKVYGGRSNSTVLEKSASSDNLRYMYSEPIDSANEDERMFTVCTYYEVLTGANFSDYANYKVMLEVQLRSANGVIISNSTQKDFIVYTNAKIHPEVIQE